MIKAILVDANVEVVNTFKAYIKGDFARMRVVAALHEASVDKFWAMVGRHQPDVIVMDIRFFGLSTLRLIGEVQANHPHVHMLISGTYDDYDYLRASMEYGATDYIYKPAKRREFELAMAHIVGVLDEAQRRAAEDAQMLVGYDTDRGFFRHRFLANLLGGVLTDKREVDTSMAYFGLSLASPAAVLVLRIDRFKKVMQGLDEKAKHLLVYRIYFHAEKYLTQNGIGHAFINSFNSITCIIGGLDGTGQLMDTANALKDTLTKRTGMAMTIGMGRIYDDMLSLRFSAAEAEAALRYRYLLGYDCIIPIDFAEPNNHLTYKYPKKKEQMLVYTAVAGEYDYAVKLLNEIFADLQAAEPLPPRLLPRIVMSIIISISRYASELGMDGQARFREFFDMGRAIEIKDVSEARGFMESGLRVFCGFVMDVIGEGASRMVALAKTRADENFFEDITLEALAVEFGTTADFLGRNFQRREGVSFKEYLQSRRIERAKEILETEDASEDEIAARVGFFDPRVFRSVFRRREGMLPMEYKK